MNDERVLIICQHKHLLCFEIRAYLCIITRPIVTCPTFALPWSYFLYSSSQCIFSVGSFSVPTILPRQRLLLETAVGGNAYIFSYNTYFAHYANPLGIMCIAKLAYFHIVAFS